MTFKLYNGNCLEELKNIPDNSVDSIVTDPPYHLTSIVSRFSKTSENDDNITGKKAKERSNNYARLSKGFMGQTWDGGDIAFRTEIWCECYRILKPGGHMLAFGGTRTYHRMACAIEDSGFEIRDQINWLYGTGFPKSHDISKDIDKKLGLERKVVSTKSMHDIRGGNLMETSQNIGQGQIDYAYTVPASDLAKQWEGWGTGLKPAIEPIVLARKPIEEDTIVENVLKYGTGAININASRIGPRWPSNVIHDGSDEVEKEFAKYGESKSTGGRICKKSTSTVSIVPTGNYAKGDPGYGDTGTPSRFFYSAKANEEDREFGNKHPTVKPLSLMQYLVKLITPPGGTVVDPFMGSGSTGKAAVQEGFNFIGVEMQKEYFAVANKRISSVKTLDAFFSD